MFESRGRYAEADPERNKSEPTLIEEIPLVDLRVLLEWVLERYGKRLQRQYQ
jgi:hypothetical protein